MKRVTWTAVLILALPAFVGADDWPQWLGPKRDGVWRETGILDKFPEGGLKPKWTSPVGSGYASAAIVGERVYIMDRFRDKDKDGKPARPTRDGIPGNERVLCLDAKNGKEIWKHEYKRAYTVSYPSGPRVTPIVKDGKVYTLGAMGDLYCLDDKTGKPVWHVDLVKEYDLDGPPVWGFSAAPLLEGDVLYTLVGGKGSAAVALHKDTGKMKWKALSSDEVGYSPPMLVEAGGKKQLIVWLSDSLNGLDPESGKPYWTQEYPIGRPATRPAVSIVTPIPHGNNLYVSTAYHGMMAVELGKEKPDAKVLWFGKSDRMDKASGLHSLMPTPVVKDGHIYGVCAMGELRCLDAKSGKEVWQTYELTGGKRTDCGTAFIVPHGDKFWVFNDDGELILAELTSKGHKVISRQKVIDPLERARGRVVVWSHPSFANKCVFVRNDKELVCISLAKQG